MQSVAIPFVRVSADQNPNISVSGQADSSASYYRSMIATFASLRRWNAGLQLLLISNEPPPPKYAGSLDEFGVELVMTEFRHSPPNGFAKHFAASLYLLDAIEAISRKGQRGFQTLLLDPDVLCISPLQQMFAQARGSVGVLPQHYPPTHSVNGLTLEDAAILHSILTGSMSPVPEYFGGEAYLFDHDSLPHALELVRRAWELSMRRHDEGKTKFVTEEHILNFALHDVSRFDLSAYARRIWTAHHHRTVSGTENGLALWHLPAEKGRGFDVAYRAAIDPASWFWTADRARFIDHAGRVFALHHRTPTRLTADWAATVLHKVKRSR